MESQSWSLSLQPKVIRSVTKSASKGQHTPLGERQTVGLLLSNSKLRSRRSGKRCLNDIVFWMVLARPPILMSSNRLTQLLGIVSVAPVTIRIMVAFMLHSFFSSLTKYIFLFSFTMISVVGLDSKVHYSEGFSFFREISLNLVF